MSDLQIGALLSQGIVAAKAGRVEQARQALMRVVELDEANVQAWLWLSSVVDDPVDKFTCLHNVLQLDPNNQPAQLGLARLNQSDPPVEIQLPVIDSEPLVNESPSVESGMPPAPEAEPKIFVPGRPTGRYKRLAPKSVSDTPSFFPPQESGNQLAKSDLTVDSVTSRRKELLNSDSQPKSSDEPTPRQKPPHLAEHASLASALIRKKSGQSVRENKIREAANQGSAVCPFCRARISVMATECDGCHLPLVVDCPDCSARIDVESSACPSCARQMGNFRNKSVYFANLAAAYQRQKKNHQAVLAWEIVQSLDSAYPDLHLQLAKAQVEAGRPNKAIRTLKLVLEAEPGQEAASRALGEIYHNLSYWDEAEEIYREALVVSPESAELHYRFGWLLADYGQTKQGVEYVRRATELDPQHGMAWFRLGQFYDVLHKPKRAAGAYRRAARLLPNGSLAHKKAAYKTSILEPELPQVLSVGWVEFIRQSAGPFMVCVVTALLDAGLRPWWIPLPGWLALLVGLMGAVLWVSGFSLPRNPVICLLVGKRGLTDSGSRIFAVVIGSFFWLLAMGIILYPLNQSAPEVPAWILNS